jgi:hypothetical protein
MTVMPTVPESMPKATVPTMAKVVVSMMVPETQVDWRVEPVTIPIVAVAATMTMAVTPPTMMVAPVMHLGDHFGRRNRVLQTSRKGHCRSAQGHGCAGQRCGEHKESYRGHGLVLVRRVLTRCRLATNIHRSACHLSHSCRLTTDSHRKASIHRTFFAVAIAITCRN